jgi:CRISPR/Cas system CSM-associated protein Csm3 (group 7 of RAMP superfamily)
MKEKKMDEKEYERIFNEGYKKGREDAAQDVRTACMMIGKDAALNIHLISVAAEG